MRPTLLNFRSPKERTPDYYDSSLTHEGHALNFRSRSINRKNSNLPQAPRFPHYQYVQGGSGVSCFIGPGTYNDQEDYLKLSKVPCSSVMKKITAVNEEESGKPCYIMVGNNLTFEPSFVNSASKQEYSEINNSECKVNLTATLQRRSISQIRQRINNGSISNNTQQMNITDRGENRQNNQMSISLIQQESDGERVNPLRIAQIQRPITQQLEKRRKVRSIGGMNGTFNQSISTKASLSGTKNQQFFPETGYYTSNASNIEKSTTVDPSLNNLHNIQEETNQSKEGRRGLGGMSDKNQVRVKSMLPKTAVNFHKMKKGLYLNPLKGYPYDIKQEALARSINILSAYGEIIPLLGGSVKKTSKSKKKYRGKSKIFEEDNIEKNGRYMTVIRDSPEVIKKREDLEKQKNNIMNMNMDGGKRAGMEEINQYMSERYQVNGQKSPLIHDDSSTTPKYNK